MTENYSTNNLLLLVLWRLGELFTHEHVHDLGPVLVVLHDFWSKNRWHLLGHRLRHGLWHHHGILVVGHLLIVASLRIIIAWSASSLSLSLAKLCVHHSRWRLLLWRDSLLPLEIVLLTRLVIVGSTGHSCLTCSIIEGRLATSLKLTHQ